MRPARHAIRPKAISRPPLSGIEAIAHLAVQSHKAGDLTTAERLYGQVLLQNPEHANSLHNLGTIRLQREDTRAAIDLLAAAARVDAQRPLFHSTLGAALQAAGEYARSEQAQRRALQLDPGHAAAWEGLGTALRCMDRFAESVTALQRALQINPESRSAARNLCNVLAELGETLQAEEICRGLLDRNPLDTDCAVPYGLLKLSRLDPSGWQEYARGHWSPEWLKLDPPVLVPLPQWDGEDLPDRGLLLYGEQGIGDEIMFASLVAAAARKAPQLALLCEPRLTPLFARSFPQVRVASRPRPGQPPLLHAQSGSELRCSLSRLPGLLHLTQRADGGAPYLRADPAAITNWRQRLSTLGSGLKVGISWRGGCTGLTRTARSISLASLAPLFDLPGVRFVNVQYGEHAGEIAAFNAGRDALHCFDDVDPLRDMDGFAALLSALDLVIAVDNSTIHLAGALGVKTWMFCPFNANWRWTRQGEGTHWYSSVRLFRQAAPEQTAWQPVIEAVAAELQNFPSAPATHELPAAPVNASAHDLLADSPTVLLINDTSYWQHWGCTGTSLALHEGLRDAGHVVDAVARASLTQMGPLPAGAADLDDNGLFLQFCQRNSALVQRIQSVREVVVNGEDLLRSQGSAARALLYLAWLARRRFGKRTSIINHRCDLAAATADSAVVELCSHVYRIMDFVAVRDDHSLRQLQRLGIEATPAFDCLPLFIAAHAPRHAVIRQRRVLLAGSASPHPALIDQQVALAKRALSMGYEVAVLVGASAFPGVDDMQWMAALHPRLRGRYTLIAATSERQWLDAIAGSGLLVSGHFHHSIAAACLRTPFMVTAGASSEFDGLIETLGLRRDAVWNPAQDLAGACRRMSALLGNPQPALVAEAQLAMLRDLARRNFTGLKDSA